MFLKSECIVEEMGPIGMGRGVILQQHQQKQHSRAGFSNAIGFS